MTAILFTETGTTNRSIEYVEWVEKSLTLSKENGCIYINAVKMDLVAPPEPGAAARFMVVLLFWLPLPNPGVKGGPGEPFPHGDDRFRELTIEWNGSLKDLDLGYPINNREFTEGVIIGFLRSL